MLDAVAPMMPLYMNDAGHAYLDVAIGPETVSAVWDTGAGITVVDASLIARHPALFNEVEPTTGMDGARQTHQTRIYIMGSVEISGVSFEAQNVADADLRAANAPWIDP